MSERKDIIKSIIVLTVICLLVSGLLAVVNSITAPISAANAAAREDAARRELIPDADNFTLIEADLSENIVSAYEATSGGDTVGYVFASKGSGFGGTIQVMVSIDTDGNIINVKTLDVTSETSTLGGKTASSTYTDQYIGKDSSLSGVDAISGATITSTAYKNCVAEAFQAFASITGEAVG